MCKIDIVHVALLCVHTKKHGMFYKRYSIRVTFCALQTHLRLCHPIRVPSLILSNNLFCSENSFFGWYWFSLPSSNFITVNFLLHVYQNPTCFPSNPLWPSLFSTNCTTVTIAHRCRIWLSFQLWQQIFTRCFLDHVLFIHIYFETRLKYKYFLLFLPLLSWAFLGPLPLTLKYP